jgi:hypothetical protein
LPNFTTILVLNLRFKYFIFLKKKTHINLWALIVFLFGKNEPEFENNEKHLWSTSIPISSSHTHSFYSTLTIPSSIPNTLASSSPHMSISP